MMRIIGVLMFGPRRLGSASVGAERRLVGRDSRRCDG